ncbi:MAG TPA: c-type cytochrome [Roseiflexaceae bacterium]|nr:c-type cytochrome [Roseiflexaceae bacterium]
MFDVVGVLVLVVLSLLFGFLAARAWQAKNVLVRWVGTLLAAIPTLVFALAAGLALYGYAKVNQRHSNPVADITVARTDEQAARGMKIARACAGCHSANGDLPLTGQRFEGPPIGDLYAANLTPTHLQDWSDGEIIRAIREGVHKDGRSLIIMPSAIFRNLSDEDVQALVAYLRSTEPVEPDTPPTRVNVVGAIMASALPLFSVQPPISAPVVAPPAGPTTEYGGYLVAASGCRECHGGDLRGGEAGGFAPSGPPIANIAERWSEQEFVNTLRTGVRSDGVPLGPGMPWRDYELFSDDDFRAIYLYLKAGQP